MYYGSSSEKNVLVCNSAADYNLESMKTKSNIYIKNEHCFVQQEIAPAYCRYFCLLICNRQPIPSRRKMLYRKRMAQQKCFSAHLPENNASISSHFLSPHASSCFQNSIFFFFLHFYFTLFSRKRLLFQCILKGNLLLASSASVRIWTVEVWCVTESEIIKDTVVGASGKQPGSRRYPNVGLKRQKDQSAGCFSQHYVKKHLWFLFIGLIIFPLVMVVSFCLNH